MDTTQLNPTVKMAFDALQNNDKHEWFSHFTPDAKFSDDGNEMNFRNFFEGAFASNEKFLRISKIGDDGKSIYGNFNAGKWGTFHVFFRFQLDSVGKINRLDIGRSN